MTAFKVPPIIKTVTFPGTLHQAFTRFTAQIGAWWPLATHSLAQATQGASVAFEALQPGGRLIETWTTGETHIWGTIIAIDRPNSLAFTWHPGRQPDHAQRIDLTFQETAPGQTRVQLTHSGWENLGETARQRRDEYDQGWNPVLHTYASPENPPP